MGLFTKVFGTYSQRELKSIYPIVDKITALEDEYKQLTDAELQAKTPEFKERLANGETLDDILPEAFAAVREAADRVLGMRPYPVQLVGGIVLHQGRIAEMKTGEAKRWLPLPRRRTSPCWTTRISLPPTACTMLLGSTENPSPMKTARVRQSISMMPS